MVDILKFFTRTDVPFTLLFVLLFLYFIKMARDREKVTEEVIITKIDSMQEDLHVLINVWKILLEKELKVQSQEVNKNDNNPPTSN